MLVFKVLKVLNYLMILKKTLNCASTLCNIKKQLIKNINNNLNIVN